MFMLILLLTEGKVFSRAEYLGQDRDSQKEVGGDNFELRNQDATERQQPRVNEKHKQKGGNGC